MPSISESFPRLARFPHFTPQSLSTPWLVAFTTLAQREGQPLDFMVGRGEANRRELECVLMPLAVTWLTLEHDTKIAILNSNKSPIADAAIITQPGRAVAFTTADCLPLVCVSTRHRVVAAIHAGWRSLAAGIVERTVECLVGDYDIQPETLKVWTGPAIAGEDYEVGDEVREALLARPAITEAHFSPSPGDSGDPTHFLADLPGAATSVLTSLGVSPRGIERCPFSTRKSPHLHSVRRDGSKAGRMATVAGVWEAPSGAQ